jgi:hypothetical protein
MKMRRVMLRAKGQSDRIDLILPQLMSPNAESTDVEESLDLLSSEIPAEIFAWATPR